VGLLEGGFDGSIRIGGEEAAKLDNDGRTRLRRDALGFVYQFHHLLPDFNATENVILPQVIRDVDMGAAKARAESLLTALGLGHRLDHRPSQLSGGEQQRVAVARAFVNRPMILIADEPTGNLDPSTSVGIMKLLDRINRTGTTVVMATHDAAIVDQMRKRVIELEGGHVVRDQSRGVYGYAR
jgi:lipoprotein-releasing system ATP-binding protein